MDNYQLSIFHYQFVFMDDKQALLRQLLRQLPSVDALLRSETAVTLISTHGVRQVTDALRRAVDESRTAIIASDPIAPPTAAVLLARATGQLDAQAIPSLRGVINGTGVIVHTNLGRAPLSVAAAAAVSAVASSYSTLEFDLDTGKRGSRAVHAAKLIAQLTGGEDAHTVNNNAAAVLLMLTALCAGEEVIISRGQLVEIGGGFRIPDVMAQSGAILVEVGTTNRTHLRDYETAINANTTAILVAHPSNYKVIGFTTEPSLAELAALAHERGIMLLYDQGSGSLLETAVYNLDPEPTVLDGVRAGADVVTFSGDKLLGGPQAGILCGRADLIATVKRHPLARAVRADKMALSALLATLQSYANGHALDDIPVWQMISRPLAMIEETAVRWAAVLCESGVEVEVVDGRSKVGGGSLPGSSLPTKLIAISHPNPDAFAARLRENDPPVIGRIWNDRFVLDPRTVFPEQEEELLRAIKNNE